MSRTVKLTCETDACENKDIAIELVTDSTNYFCGGCMNPITNAVEVVEEVIHGTPEETV